MKTMTIIITIIILVAGCTVERPSLPTVSIPPLPKLSDGLRAGYVPGFQVPCLVSSKLIATEQGTTVFLIFAAKDSSFRYASYGEWNKVKVGDTLHTGWWKYEEQNGISTKWYWQWGWR